MKNKKWQSAKTVGNETESIVKTWLIELGYNFRQENTIANTRIRCKGSVDFTSDTFAIEVKRFTKLLTFKIGSEIHDLKWSQIEILNKACMNGKTAAILITEDNVEFYFINISTLLLWICNNSRKSINSTIAKEIGYIIKDKEDLKRVLEGKA
jgi:hypothetical protein